VSRLNARRAQKRAYHHGDLKNALIAAGVDLLSKQGVAALSLRKVAQHAGVSHAAPYAHFADKQALIAAISTEGYRHLYAAISAAAERYEGDPARQLVEGAWAYLEFALEDTDHFRVAMSGIVEKEDDYPAFVEMSQKSFSLLLRIVGLCQGRGILRPGPTELVAVSLWSLVHGLVSLLLEKQIPSSLRDRCEPREMLLAALRQVATAELSAPTGSPGSRSKSQRRASRAPLGPRPDPA
jgi:AcrR family transcriptional regulator